MATNNLLDTKTVTLNELLGNGKIYKVPQFQRDYSWTKDNWEDLWNDIMIARNTGKAHYLGAIVLQNKGAKLFEIIDGQQRFTTISLLILAVIDAINTMAANGVDTEANKERINLLMSQYIGQKDAASLTYSNKLELNENNNGFYKTKLVNFRSDNIRGKTTSTDKLLWDAYSFFKEKLDDDLKLNKGDNYASFLNQVVGDQLMFIQITVEDELNAYTVFETLNSRGVELTSADLLKNYLFSLVAESKADLDLVKILWKKIVDYVELTKFPAFLRYYIMATRKQITKDYLFKEIKAFVKNGNDVFALLNNLDSYAAVYAALGNADDDKWIAEKDTRNAISILKSLQATQWKPLAMVADHKFAPAVFRRLLDAIITISFRYNVIAKLQTNEMEKVYSAAAINLFQSATPSINAVLKDLKPIYVGDDDFRKYFELKDFDTDNSTDKKLARYTLYKIEAQYPGGAKVDFENDNGTIEHILPVSHPEAWQENFSDEQFQKNKYKLGNLTLLEASKNNKSAANKSFAEKKEVYAGSKFAMTNQIDADDWTPEKIKHRQAELGKFAAAVWRIQF